MRELRDGLSNADFAALDITNPEDVRALLDRIGSEPQIGEIHAWSQCTPRLSNDAASREQPSGKLEPEMSEG